jgi:hypothetical protein
VVCRCAKPGERILHLHGITTAAEPGINNDVFHI